MKSRSGAATLLASVCAATMLVQASVASAQPAPGDDGPPPPAYEDQTAPSPPAYDDRTGPPPGEYAPPPQGAERRYDDRARQYDEDYSSRYQQWAAQYCVERHNTNVAAGAIIGGILGAVIGSNIAGGDDRGAGAVVGGALGAGAGATVGASASSANCPPGYVVRAGAPGFYFAGPAYGVYGPAWYQPWVFEGGVWVYRPYRSWYWRRGYRRRW
jgi:hypothetical protein